MKTVCIYHSIDLDGWMSAAIVKHWFNKQKRNYLNSKVFKEVDVDFGTLDFIGYNYGQPIPDLSEYDKVIMCDISFPKDKMFELYTDLGTNIIWIEHHISAIKDVTERLGGDLFEGIRDTKFAACELTWKYFFHHDEMPEIVRLLGRYDCFGHKGTEEEELVLGFQYGARQKISNYEEAHEWLTMCLDHPEICNEIQNAGDEIYKYLCTEAKQAYKNGFAISLPNITIPEEEYVFLCINKERFNPINFGIDYHKDGYDGAACFWYDKREWAFSLYNDNGEVDCSAIAKQYGGGGHRGAAGFRIKNLNEIFNGSN